jgi:hypothetical protein
MGAIVYPAGLPRMQLWPTVPRERRAGSGGEGIKAAPRARSRDRIADIDAQWFYKPAHMAVWAPWYEDTLLNGTRWFAINAPGPGGWRQRVCRYRTGTVRREALPGGHWRVTAQLEQRGRSQLPQALECFEEHFVHGLAPYSSPSGGGLERFEIVASPYGNALRYIGATSAIDYNIARDVPDSPFETFSAKFLVESASVDNSAYLIVGRTAGGEAINLRPRSESFEDAAQRMRLAIGSGAAFIGASALALNVWHELTATRAGAYELTRLDTAAVVASGTLTTGYGEAQEINSLFFVEDSNLGSCSTQFTDLEICPPD